MITVLLSFLLAVVFVEGLTELIVKSNIFYNVRSYLASNNEFLGELVSCGHCTSVWVSLLPALYFSFQFHSLLLIIPLTIVFHRLSNYLHNINDKFLDKYYSKDYQSSKEV